MSSSKTLMKNNSEYFIFILVNNYYYVTKGDFITKVSYACNVLQFLN